MSEVPADRTVNIVIRPMSAGLIVGLVGCGFGVLGIFAYGLIFAPLGIICAISGFALSLFGRSAWGVVVSLLAGMLNVAAALKTPLLLILLGAGLIASLFHTPATKGLAPPVTSAGNQPSVLQASTPVPGSAASTIQSAPSTADQGLVQLAQASNWATSQIAVADTDLSQIPNIGRHYQELTTQMEAWATQRNELPADLGPQRDRLASAIAQAAAEASRLHDQDVGLEQRIERVALPHAQQVKMLVQKCREQPDPSQAAQSACADLSSNLDSLGQKYLALGHALEQLDQTYDQEHTKQQQIIAQL